MPPDDNTRAAHDALTLLGIPRIGVREWHKRVREFGGARAALDDIGSTPQREAAEAVAHAALDRATALGAQVLVYGTRPYPVALHDLTDCDSADIAPAPPVFFALGDVARLAQPAVAIVGTRHASGTGLRAAESIARGCADAGALVISGLARGIDAAAHTGALAGAASTAAVVGTGIDICYPADHRTLQHRIARDGVVLTEQLPGARATRGSFPERNRLIAALAPVTIVVEAGQRSGALLTAKAAVSLNRACAAVPGAFDAASCRGSNELLRDGAHVISSLDDALALLELSRADDTHALTPPQLSAAERAIWDVLGAAPLELDLVVERSGWAADACLAAVTTLELKGLVRATHAGALHRA